MSAYAVIKTGGKQLRVAEDDLIVVEKLAGEPGQVVSFAEVLMLADGKDLKIGAPLLSGVAVHGQIEDQRRADKITVIKKRRRKGYRRTKGHRQLETVVRITALGGEAPAPSARKTRTAAPKPKPKPAASDETADAPALETKAKAPAKKKPAAKTSTAKTSSAKKPTTKKAGVKTSGAKKPGKKPKE